MNERLADILRFTGARAGTPSFSTKERIRFFHRLGTLLRAGVPLLPATRMMRGLARGTSATRLLETLESDVERGRTLAASLAGTGAFDVFAVAMIETGEASGALGEHLLRLAAGLAKARVLRRKIAAAAAYPAFVVAATFGITALLVGYVFPKVLPIFRSVGVPLPWTTRALLFMSSTARRGWPFFLAGSAMLAVAGGRALRRERIRLAADRFRLALPVIGPVARGAALASSFRAIGALLAGGTDAVAAARIAARGAGNLAYRRALDDVAERVAGGGTLSSALLAHGALFPVSAAQMAEVGEQTGDLGAALASLADQHDQEVDELTKDLTAILEPALLLVMGVVVGFVAVSIISPMYAITERIGG